MHPRDVLVHRIVAGCMVAFVGIVWWRMGPVAAGGLVMTSGVPIAVLTWSDRRYYGPKDKDE